MKVFRDIKPILERVLSGGVSAKETRDLIQYCAFLALPLVRKKVRFGLLNPVLLAMTEEDVVYDALAELFRRDNEGKFLLLQSSFAEVSIEDQSDEEIVIHLRRLVFVNVHKTIIRLYTETDPVMGKILRNLKLGIGKSGVFEEGVRFGETVLVVKNADPLFGRPCLALNDLQRAIGGVVNVHDTIPTVLSKLYALLTEQEQFQRVVPLFQLAATIKSVYVVGWETEQVVVPNVEEEMDTQNIRQMVARICREEADEMRQSHVQAKKISEEMLAAYARAMESILQEEYLDTGTTKRSYYDHFVEYAPTVSHMEYRERHRATLEYAIKKIRKRVQGLLKAM